MTDTHPGPRREPVNVDALPPVQWLILGTLAARARLGERTWPFPNRMKPALRALAEHGLIEYEPHNASEPGGPGYQRASFTEQGRQIMLPPNASCRSPLEQEVDRLVNLRADEIMQQTGLEGIDVEDGSITVRTRPPHGLVVHLAAQLAGWLGDAENYTETDFRYDPSAATTMESHPAGSEHWYLLTVQRKFGKTPHQLRREAEERAHREERAADLLIEILRQIKHLAHRDPDEVRRLADRGPVAAREIREAR